MVESQRHEQVKAQLEKTKLEVESLNSQVTINKQEWQKRQTHLLNLNESLMVMIIVENTLLMQSWFVTRCIIIIATTDRC